jgi:hypothetical protein
MQSEESIFLLSTMVEAYNFPSVEYSTAVGTNDGEIPDIGKFVVDRGVVMLDDEQLVVCEEEDVKEHGYSREIWIREIPFCNIRGIKFENIVSEGGNHRMGRVTIDTDSRGVPGRYVLKTTREEMRRFRNDCNPPDEQDPVEEQDPPADQNCTKAVKQTSKFIEFISSLFIVLKCLVIAIVGMLRVVFVILNMVKMGWNFFFQYRKAD